MKPEFPPEFPLFGDARIGVMETPDMECRMLRLGMQCNNATKEALLFSTSEIASAILPICEMCLKEVEL